jgi:hypothetical protein
MASIIHAFKKENCIIKIYSMIEEENSSCIGRLSLVIRQRRHLGELSDYGYLVQPKADSRRSWLVLIGECSKVASPVM